MNMIDNMSRYRTNQNKRRLSQSQSHTPPTPPTELLPHPLPAIPVKQHINECPICMDPITPNSNVIITNCNHQFCSTCLLREMKNRHTCPVCRRELIEKPKKKSMTDNDLRDIVLENISLMPQEHLNIADKLIQLLNESNIQELFEADINIADELKDMETNILTTMTLFGYYLATDVRRTMMISD
tara:strand:- start:1708 stop:2262 length:555 start_codon:yes stop_codon:yes gene_type:complete